MQIEGGPTSLQVFKESNLRRSAIIAEVFHYHFINAKMNVEVRRNIVELYIRAPELDPSTFDSVKPPLASSFPMPVKSWSS